MMSKKKIVLLGSTGSIGLNALKCVDNSPDEFAVVGLSTHVNVEMLTSQAKSVAPQAVAVTGRPVTDAEQRAFKDLNIS